MKKSLCTTSGTVFITEMMKKQLVLVVDKREGTRSGVIKDDYVFRSESNHNNNRGVQWAQPLN